MASPALDYHFAAPVLRLETGLRQHYVPLPHDIADAFQAAGVRRLAATLNGHPVRRALQGRRDGERYVMLSHDLLRQIGARFGDIVTIHLQPDPEPDRIDLADELVEALRQDAAAAERFYGFTPGLQRSLAHYVNSAKRPETRVRRALELARKLRTYTLSSDLHPGA